jgi:hypothetical protein
MESLMSEIVVASINSLLSSQQAELESQSEDPIFVLTSHQLQDLITKAVEKAIQLLHEEVSALQEQRDQDRQEMAALRRSLASLEATQDHQGENQFIQLQLINRIREDTKKEATPTQEDRADMLRALLVSHGGKVLAKDARRKMHMRKNKFSELLAVCDFVTLKPYHLDNRQKIIILKSELVPGN